MNCCRNSICTGNNGQGICSQVLGTNTSPCNASCADTQQECPCTEQTLQDVLCECVGLKCNCEFEIDGDLVSRTGVLERVGSDYLLLRSTSNHNAMLCYLCQLRFVTVTC